MLIRKENVLIREIWEICVPGTLRHMARGFFRRCHPVMAKFASGKVIWGCVSVINRLSQMSEWIGMGSLGPTEPAVSNQVRPPWGLNGS